MDFPTVFRGVGSSQRDVTNSILFRVCIVCIDYVYRTKDNDVLCLNRRILSSSRDIRSVGPSLTLTRP